jgi:NodT family efflux transporter outer membrane factor (OMF) lipoprotein
MTRGIDRLAVPLLAVGALLLTGCITVGPDYEQPETEIPDAWHTAAIEGLNEGEATLQTWWQVFDDPTLNDLIGRAAEANLDLELAVWRVEEARAFRGVAAGPRVPQVELSGESSRSQPSENGALGDFAPEGGFDAANLHDYSVGAGWELDLWGRIRRSVESADAAVEASVEDYRDVLVSVLAEVALSYFDVRTLQERIRFAEANVEAQRNTLSLTQDRFNVGLVSALDTTQAESNLANTESLIPTLETDLQLALNRVAVLLGQPPGAVHAELEEVRPLPAEPPGVAAGLPADLLRQRPDVRRAERQLASQTALIGVATADLYPTFSLGGFIGLQSVDGSDLLSGDSVTWGIGLPIRWDLFSGGRIRSQIRVEEARTQQALVRYEQTVLFALEEAEGAMVSYDQRRRRREKLRTSVDATERSLDLVMTQYTAGLTDFQNVLDTQRSLLNRQDELAVTRGGVIRDLIGIYRALGGGWDPTSSAVGVDVIEVSSGDDPFESETVSVQHDSGR